MGRFIFFNKINNTNMENNFSAKSVYIQTFEHPAYILRELVDTQKIVLNKNHTWDIATKSQFIESILLRLPLDPVYVWEDYDHIFNIINGRNRLNALHEFLNGEFELQGLKYFPDLNGHIFSQLERYQQNTISSTNFILYCVRRETAAHILEELSKRFSNPK